MFLVPDGKIVIGSIPGFFDGLAKNVMRKSKKNNKIEKS